jgi:NAD(P)-dependent dehydrogenase (short-subunit alcohol dehydrogenase family)
MSAQDLAGKVALITGCASPGGIGFATARLLAQHGAAVMLTDLDAGRVAHAATMLREAGARAQALAHDVVDAQQWDAVIAATLDRFGGIDILVNNAGRALLRPLPAHTVDEIDTLLAVNLRGVILGARATVAAMKHRRRGGAIVNVSSVAGIVGTEQMSVYSATKGGVRLFTKALALEVAADGIRCNSVHPGMIDTELFHASAAGDPAVAAAIQATIPMQRLGNPEDIAHCIAYLASDQAGYVTGAEFVVDGGFSAR